MYKVMMIEDDTADNCYDITGITHYFYVVKYMFSNPNQIYFMHEHLEGWL